MGQDCLRVKRSQAIDPGATLPGGKALQVRQGLPRGSSSIIRCVRRSFCRSAGGAPDARP